MHRAKSGTYNAAGCSSNVWGTAGATSRTKERRGSKTDSDFQVSSPSAGLPSEVVREVEECTQYLGDPQGTPRRLHWSRRVLCGVARTLHSTRRGQTEALSLGSLIGERQSYGRSKIESGGCSFLGGRQSGRSTPHGPLQESGVRSRPCEALHKLEAIRAADEQVGRSVVARRRK